MAKSIYSLVDTEMVLRKFKGDVPFFTRHSISAAIKTGDFPKPMKALRIGTGTRVFFSRFDLRSFIRDYIPIELLSDEELEKNLG